MSEIESIIALLWAVAATTTLTTLGLALGAGAWAHARPSIASAWTALVGALPALVLGVLFVAVRLSIGEEENDRFLFPLTASAALIELLAGTVALVTSHRAARHIGVRPPLLHPAGIALTLTTFAATAAFLWTTWD